MAIRQDILDQYKSINWKSLLRDDLWESGKLDEIEPSLDRIKSVFEKVISYQSTLEQVPNYERSFENVIQDFLNVCNNEILSNYSDVTQRQNKLTRIRQLEESLIGQLNPILTYMQFVDPDNKSKQKELDKKTKEIEIKLQEIDELTKKVQESVKVSWEIAEGQEVQIYWKEFEVMAEGVINNQDYGWYWKNKLFKFFKPCLKTGNLQNAKKSQLLMFLSLFATTVLAMMFVFGKELVLVWDGSYFEKLWSTILEQNVLLKIFLISAGGYLVAHFSRNYSAEMNMYYTNKHRQMALNSHQRILDSVRATETNNNDAETKNAILLQVTKTMFDIQETGYLKNWTNPVPTTQIIETVRSGISKN